MIIRCVIKKPYPNRIEVTQDQKRYQVPEDLSVVVKIIVGIISTSRTGAGDIETKERSRGTGLP